MVNQYTLRSISQPHLCLMATVPVAAAAAAVSTQTMFNFLLFSFAHYVTHPYLGDASIHKYILPLVTGSKSLLTGFQLWIIFLSIRKPLIIRHKSNYYLIMEMQSMGEFDILIILSMTLDCDSLNFNSLIFIQMEREEEMYEDE